MSERHRHAVGRIVRRGCGLESEQLGNHVTDLRLQRGARRKRVALDATTHDWILIRLGARGTISTIEVDTNHFKGNYPDTCSLEGCFLKEDLLDFANAKDIAWQEILPRTKLQAQRASGAVPSSDIESTVLYESPGGR